MHNQVGVGDALVDFLDALDGQHVAGRRLGELVGTVAGTDGNGQRVHLGGLDEGRRFFRIGQHLAVIQRAVGTDAVFFTGLTGFQAAQAAQLAFHRHAAGVGERHGLLGHAHVVVVVGRGLAVFTQRAVHHHRAETQLDGTLADVRAGAVILVHAHRDVREFFDGSEDQVTQERGTGVLAGTGGGLDDHRGVGLVGRFHDGAHLFEVVDVECRHAVAVLGGVVQQLTHADKGHLCCSQSGGLIRCPACRRGRLGASRVSRAWRRVVNGEALPTMAVAGNRCAS